MYKKVKFLFDRKACLGCGLCLENDTQKGMCLAEDGYYHPTEGASIDKRMQEYCPGYGIHQPRKRTTIYETLYGPVVAPVICGHSTDSDLNYKASSGGVITTLLITLLRNGLVDAVLQVRQSPKDPTKTEPVLSSTEEEVLSCMGSRYAPCSLFEHLHEYLSTGKRLAVVGKPCDIAALNQYCRIYPNHTHNILYTFSIMCMGLPSHKSTLEMVKYLGAGADEVKTIRYRGYGWPGMAMVETKEGTKNECTYIQSWGAILGRDTMFRCKVCPNGFGEFADVSCGDAWHCVDGEPSFENTEAGRSFIFMRSKKGQELVEKAIADGLLAIEPYDMSEMQLIQKSQYKRKVNLPIRYIIYKLLVNPSFTIDGFQMLVLARTAGIKSLLEDGRGFLGRWWRGYKGHSK